MMAFRAFGRTFGGLVVAVAMLSGCGDDRFPDYSYKMTVYAGGKAFSTVRHVEVEEVVSIVDSGGSTVKRRVEGEAVILVLGGGHTAYALISRPDDTDYAQFVASYALTPFIPKDAPLSDMDQAVKEYRDEHKSTQDSFGSGAASLQKMVAVQGAKDLPRTRPNHDPYRGPRTIEQWPMFVTFDDPKDPKTVREVTPGEIGVSRITIEITDEPVTTGIEERLGWLPEYYNKQFSGSRFQKLDDYKANGLSAVMSSGAFSTGSGMNSAEGDK